MAAEHDRREQGRPEQDQTQGGPHAHAPARLIKPGKQHLSLPATLLLGLACSVIGGAIANLLDTGDIFELNILGLIVAVIAAVALIGLAEGMVGRRRVH